MSAFCRCRFLPNRNCLPFHGCIVKRPIKHPKTATETLQSRPRTESRLLKRNQLDRPAAIARCEARTEWRRATAAYQDLEELLSQEYERLVRLAASRGCNEPQDAVQDACLKAFESYEPSRGRLLPFFKTVLIYGILDGFRRFYHRERAKERYENQCSEAQANYSYSREKQVELLDQLLDRLPEDERKTLRASYMQSPQADLAVSLGIKPGTLRVRLLRARIRLRALFKQMGIESLADLESMNEVDFCRQALRRSPAPAVKSPRPRCRKSPKTQV